MLAIFFTKYVILYFNFLKSQIHLPTYFLLKKLVEENFSN